MRKLIFTIVACTSMIVAKAQVKMGDNPTSINTNSVLEMESTNKGMLPPRVALTAANNAAPLSAFVTGMTVYNTATAGTAPYDVVPGYYFCDGTQWVKLSVEDCVNNSYIVIDESDTPPASQAEGDTYQTLSAPTGDWGGNPNSIAIYDGTVWNFTPLQECDHVYNTTTGITRKYKNGNLVTVSNSNLTKAGYWKKGGNVVANAGDSKIGTLNMQPLSFITGGAEAFRADNSTLALMSGSSKASGSRSFAWGHKDTASGEASIALGYGTNASGYHAIATGENTVASGDGSTATGVETIASGNMCTAMGYSSVASGFASTAIGMSNMADGGSIAIGNNNTADGPSSVSLGNQNRSAGGNSIAIGFSAVATTFMGTVMGCYNENKPGAHSYGPVASDPLFIVGNGDSYFQRGNGFVMLRNGKTLINATGSFGYVSPRASLDVLGTDGIIVPNGTTAERPAAPAFGTLRYNTDTGRGEMYVNDLDGNGIQGDAGWRAL